MGPVVDPVSSDETLPQRVSVVIVGGGIIGASAALFLAKRGVSVALCEKGQIAGEQSSRNWGWVRKMGRDPREIPLIIESLRLWEGMNETVEAETGFRRTGILYACETDEEVERRAGWLEYARPYQLDTRLLRGAELADLLPGAVRLPKAGLYTRSDGRAEPQKAAPAIARAARRAGAAILTNCAVRGIETQGGQVAAAVTEKGRIACESVVLAGGAWSRLFCGNLGLRLPQLKVRSSVMRTEPLEGAPETATLMGDFAFRKRLDGGYIDRQRRQHALRHRARQLPVPRSTSCRRCRLEYRSLHFGWAPASSRSGGMPTRWKLDEPSPFERVRVLDPEPDELPQRDRQGEPGRGVPGLRECQGGAAVGRAHRRDARCRAGHLAGRQHPRLLHRDRLLGPRLRHRAGRRPARGRPRDRQRPDRRSDAVPLLALHRRLAAAARSPASRPAMA